MADLDLGQLGHMTGAWDMLTQTLDILKKWVPAALTAINDTGYGAPNEKFVGVMTWGRLPETEVESQANEVPAVYVSSPGTTGAPVIVGNGTDYSAWYILRVVVVDRAMTWDVTAERAQIWAGVIRQTLLQHQDLNGIAVKFEWTGETFNPIPADQGRTFGGAVISFKVLLNRVSQQGNIGPFTPLPVVDPTTGLLLTALPDGPVAVAFEDEVTTHAPV